LHKQVSLSIGERSTAFQAIEHSVEGLVVGIVISPVNRS
jgi:hypothetical protein